MAAKCPKCPKEHKGALSLAIRWGTLAFSKCPTCPSKVPHVLDDSFTTPSFAAEAVERTQAQA